ncbi:MAG: S41 family peptidase, partial [Acidobacteriota bacterium]
TLYVQLNEISNDGSQPLAEFMASAVALAKSHRAQRLVLDLRKNHGGSGSWNRGVLLALLDSEFGNEFGRLYVLIGRRTFSAAIMLVGLLEQWTEAIFVGEPTGSALNQFGDPKKFQLENSGLTVRVSTILWHSWLAGDNRPAFPPHISATLSGRDFFAGRDPVLAAASTYEASKSLDAQFRDLLEIDLNHAAIWALKRSTDPSEVSLETESAIDLAGRKLLEQDRPDLSRYAYLIGLSIFPESEVLQAGLEKVPTSDG